MKRQGVWLVAGLVALTGWACFSDPTDSLHNGPATVAVSAKAITITSGESLAVNAVLKDEAGASLQATDVSWTSADPTIAEVRVDTDKPAPGEVFSRAFIRGVTATGGVTSVTLVINGITDSVRVTVLPAAFPVGGAAIIGTAGTDTVTLNRPSPQPPLVTIYNAGDTLRLTTPAGLTFAGNAGVTFGADPGITVSNTGTVLKVMARRGFVGRPTVNNLVAAGSAQTGPITIASLRTADSIQIEHARWRGANVVTNDANFGTATVLTVTAPAGVTFNGSSSIAIGGVPAVGSTPTVVPVNLIRLSQTATVMTAIAPSNQAAALLIKGALVGTVVIDSLRVGTAPVATTINKSSFPGTVTGNANLLDVITINSGAAATFTTTPAASASQVTIGAANGVAQQAFIVSRTATVITAIAKVPNAGPITVSNVIISGSTIPALATAGNVVVAATTGETGEPGNNTSAAPTPIGTFAGAADTITVYKSVDCEDDGTACPGNGDNFDWFSFTTPATANIRVVLDWFGNGAAGNPAYGSQPENPDLDLYVCVTTVCSNNAANRVASDAGLTQPATASSAVTQPAGTYYIRVEAYVTATPITYRLRILRF